MNSVSNKLKRILFHYIARSSFRMEKKKKETDLLVALVRKCLNQKFRYKEKTVDGKINDNLPMIIFKCLSIHHEHISSLQDCELRMSTNALVCIGICLACVKSVVNIELYRNA